MRLLLASVTGPSESAPIPPLFEGHSGQLADHREWLAKIGPGQVALGHIHYSPEWASLLKELGVKHIFLYRDPRDMAVSLASYYTRQAPNHAGYEYLSGSLHDDQERLRAIITGFEYKGVKVPDLDRWYRAFIGWRDEQHTLSLSFDDLIGSRESRRAQIRSVFRYLQPDYLTDESEDDLVDAIQARIDPALMRAVETAESISWRDLFDAETKAVCKAFVGTLLIELGYEADLNW